MRGVLDGNRNAVNKAFSRWHSALGLESDSDLDLYKTLNEDDFTRISDKYGREDTIAYIREMESRMRKQGRK